MECFIHHGLYILSVEAIILEGLIKPQAFEPWEKNPQPGSPV